MATKELLRLANTLQAVKLVEHNLKSKNKKTKDIVKLGVDNIIGTSLIKANSSLIVTE